MTGLSPGCHKSGCGRHYGLGIMVSSFIWTEVGVIEGTPAIEFEVFMSVGF